ncbi:Ankyrin repeat-containing protein ITN1 [Camellia lanceoleosa]|uniref:Ankyrin repeat-containing protein ITN1 n=1 Tax=Camellia lanceoleosa TaxID=1840588 RepID=A0ACC0I0K8_9ERIC|nr:Ankyrin repeat-containing protein ITN1 [Camellia lanceoleosa]
MIIAENEEKERAEFEKSIPIDVGKARDTHLIVATLIATVTFAAGFTMPGGYNSNNGPNQGMAILTREAAFKAFVVTDSMAMILSTCAVLIYFALADYGDQTKLLYRYSLTAGLLMIATGAMVLAFITGIYAVLPHSSSLAIPIWIIGCFSFVIYYCLFKENFHKQFESISFNI